MTTRGYKFSDEWKKIGKKSVKLESLIKQSTTVALVSDRSCNMKLTVTYRVRRVVGIRADMSDHVTTSAGLRLV